MKNEIEPVFILKKKYRPAMRIRLLRMDDYRALPSGTLGTVVGVDDIGSIMMRWDNGSTLSLIPGIDDFEIVNEPKDYE